MRFSRHFPWSLAKGSARVSFSGELPGCILQDPPGEMQSPPAGPSSGFSPQLLSHQYFPPKEDFRYTTCFPPAAFGREPQARVTVAPVLDAKELLMDLTPWNLQIWLPVFFVLGLIVMGLMFAFIAACDKI